MFEDNEAVAEQTFWLHQNNITMQAELKDIAHDVHSVKTLAVLEPRGRTRAGTQTDPITTKLRAVIQWIW